MRWLPTAQLAALQGAPMTRLCLRNGNEYRRNRLKDLPVFFEDLASVLSAQSGTLRGGPPTTKLAVVAWPASLSMAKRRQ
jgi:hypothetical protein